MTCRRCGAALPADADPRRLYCGATCRVMASRLRRRAEDAEHRAKAVDLLTRQAEAIRSGADETVLAALAREADALLVDPRRPPSTP